MVKKIGSNEEFAAIKAAGKPVRGRARARARGDARSMHRVGADRDLVFARSRAFLSVFDAWRAY